MASGPDVKVPFFEYSRKSLRHGTKEAKFPHEADHQSFITLTNLDKGTGESGVVHISDVRHHYSNNSNNNRGTRGGHEPFYYKPYFHLQQQWQDTRHARKKPCCLPWLTRVSQKDKPEQSTREGRSTELDASFVATGSLRPRKIYSQSGRTQSSDSTAEHSPPDAKQEADSTSLKDYWMDFLSQTSWHGCRLVVDSTKRIYIRLIFFLIVISTTFALIHIVLSLTTGALEFKTVTRTMVFVDTDRRFPTITICNMCPFSFRGKNHSDPFFRILANASQFHALLPPITTTDPEFERFLGRSAEELFKEYVMDLGLVSGTYGSTTVTEEDFVTIFTEEGPCYQFNGLQQAQVRGHWNVTSHGRNSGLRLLVNIHQDDYGIVFDNNAGLRVFVSHASESPDLKSGGVDIMPGTSTRLALTQNEYSFLPSPFRSYGSEGCVETDKHSDTLREKMPTGESYDFQRCRDLCVVRQASRICGCFVVGLEMEGLPPCKVYDMLYGCLRMNIDDLRHGSKAECDCPRPCSFIRYDVVVSASQMPSTVSLPLTMKYLNITQDTRVRENFLELRIFFESDLVRRESHVAQYTIQSYLSSLGGQMGICMGASLISLVELLEAILYTGLVLARRGLARLMTLTRLDRTKPRCPTV